jgi:hypothetical protein
MGLVIFGVIGVYFFTSLVAVAWAVSYAKKNGKSIKKWGWGAALVMYLIPLWDWIPSMAVHQFYCAKDAGFWVYKPLDTWEQENPGVMETLAMNHLPEQYRDKTYTTGIYGDSKYLLPDGTSLVAKYDVRRELIYVEYKKTDGTSGYQLNERFRYMYKHTGPSILNLWSTEYVLMEIKTSEVLARQVDFSTHRKGVGYFDWKFWLHSEGCSKDHFSGTSIYSYSTPETYSIHSYIDRVRK